MSIQVFKDIPKGQLKYGIFDFDNGIVDTESVFAEFDCLLLNNTLEKLGLTPDLTPQQIRLLAGHSGSEKLKIIATEKGFDAEVVLDEFNTVRTEQRQTLFRDRSVTFANGLDMLLEHLDENRALATNKKAAKLFPDLDAMGIRDMFEIIVTSDGLNKKPVPDVILKAMEELGATPQSSVYFGDNIQDIEAARAAGTTAIGFIIEGLEGHNDRIMAMQTAGADAVIDDYGDIVPYFS